MKNIFALVFAFSSIAAFAQTPDLFGYSSDSSNTYTVQNTDGRVAVTIPQNEVAGVLLLRGHGAVRDTFGRVTWFDAAGNTIVKQVPGNEFKLSANLLATYTRLSYAKVYNRAGKEIFSTTRPVSGVTVSDRRFGWIDSWNKSLEVLDLDGKRVGTFPFVQNAWLSDGFILTKDASRMMLYGRGQKLFPTETAAAVQISNTLAVLTTVDGRVKVYSPDRWLFTRAGVKSVQLTGEYLALTDASGLDVYHPDGTFAGHYLSGVETRYTNRFIAIQQAGGATVILDPTREGSPALTYINRGTVLLSPTQALSLNGDFYELYALDRANFGRRLLGGPRVHDADAHGVVGLSVFGFLNPNAKSAQVFVPGAVGTQELRTVLDLTFINKLDVSVEAPSLNWTMF